MSKAARIRHVDAFWTSPHTIIPETFLGPPLPFCGRPFVRLHYACACLADQCQGGKCTRSHFMGCVVRKRELDTGLPVRKRELERQSHTDMPAQHDQLEITTMDALFTDFGIAMLGVLLVGMPFFGKRFD